MNIRKSRSSFLFSAIILALSLFAFTCPLPPYSAMATEIKVNPGTLCKKLGQTATYKDRLYKCIKLGKYLYWNNGVAVKPAPTPTQTSKSQPAKTPVPSPTPSPTPSQAMSTTPAPKPEPTPNLTSSASRVLLQKWGAPAIYDLRAEKNLSFEFTLDTDGLVDTPRIEASFVEPYKTWEIPAQTKTVTAVVTPVAIEGLLKTYRVSLTIDSRQAIGKWTWTISPITYSGKRIGSISLNDTQAAFDFRRETYGGNNVINRAAGELYSYESFKDEKYQLYPWEGKNVVLLTKTNNLSPAIMGRILYALDTAYDTYRSISLYSPSSYRTYNKKTTIGVLAANEIGCGAACGRLGATGIELSQPLFNRLYNGVERFDQYDQPLFYELGRNFWDYAGIQRVLTKGGNGSWNSDPFWDVSTTGFACFMRALTVEVNNIPMQPWDGNNTNWQAFLDETKSLAYLQRDSSTATFSNTFQVKKPPYSGNLGATDFWASIMFYFAEGKNIEIFTRDFFQALKQQGTPNSTAQVVGNFVKALSSASGKDVSDIFYNTLRFQDARTLP